MRRLLAASAVIALLSITSCACKDGGMMSGVDTAYKPCGMSCIKRDGRNCKCSTRCPCWKRNPNGGRVHVKGGEQTSR